MHMYVCKRHYISGPIAFPYQTVRITEIMQWRIKMHLEDFIVCIIIPIATDSKYIVQGLRGGQKDLNFTPFPPRP